MRRSGSSRAGNRGTSARAGTKGRTKVGCCMPLQRFRQACLGARRDRLTGREADEPPAQKVRSLSRQTLVRQCDLVRDFVRDVNESSAVFDVRKWCAEALFAGRFRRGGWIERRSRNREGIASVIKKTRRTRADHAGSSLPLTRDRTSGPKTRYRETGSADRPISGDAAR